MLFSFIIPTYNNEDYLLECVDSIKKVSSYTKQSIDVVVVDDGSYDNSSRFCDNLSLEPNITIIHQTNSGVSNARNHGVDIANGDYIIFIDADDYIDSIKLANCINIIANDKEIDMLVYGISFNYYSNKKCYSINEIIPIFEGKNTIQDCISRIKDLFTSNSLSSVCTRIIKTKLIKDNHLRFNEDMFLFEDLDLIFRLMSHCSNLFFVKKPIYNYRQTEREDNFQKRLKRIPHLNTFIERLESSANDLYKMCEKKSNKKDIEDIFLNVYLFAINDKINVSSRNEIEILCNDFSNWWYKKNINADSLFIEKILKCDIRYFLIKRIYIRTRHSIVKKIKYLINRKNYNE